MSAKEAFAGTEFWGHIDGNDWLRWDTIDTIAKENFTEYCRVQEELRERGYEIADVQIEHDCISGFLKRVVDDTA